MAMISDALPRTTVGRRLRSATPSGVRTGREPTATGSRTHGVPASLAASTASSMATRCSDVGVPRLTSKLEATRANGPASVGISTIAAAAPTESSALAVKLITTSLVMQCTRGVWERTSSRADWV
jgi:hypothetical protein